MRNALASRVGSLPSALLVALLGTGTLACRADTPQAQTSSSTGEATAPAPPGAEQVRIGGVLWYVDYDAALAVAREQDKALWVHFGENPG